MIGYVKLKSENKEIYLSDFLEKLKNKSTKLSKLKYNIYYFFYKFIVFMKYLGNIITVKKFYNSYIFIFPFDIKDVNKYKIKKTMSKLQKLINKYKVNSIVLSNNLKAVINTKEYSINFLNENSLILYLIKEALNYVLEIKNTKTELEDLYVCIKELNKFYVENIYYLSNYFKTINIITPNINKFQKIVNKLEENGALVTLANNKEKSLKKSKLIVNFDFTKEELSKYTIYRRAIIISIEESRPYNNPGFEGIEIKNAQVDISKELKDIFKKNYLLENFSLFTLYKCLLFEKESFEAVKKKMEENELIVTKLYGNNGEISNSEYLNIL